MLVRSNRASEAIPIYVETIEGFRRSVGEHSPYVIAAMLRVAAAQQAAGHTAEAEGAMASAREVADRDFAGDLGVVRRIEKARERIERIRASHPLRCGD